MSTFKFNFEISSPGERQRDNQRHDPPSRQNWNSGGEGDHDTCNSRYKQSRDGIRRNEGVIVAVTTETLKTVTALLLGIE